MQKNITIPIRISDWNEIKSRLISLESKLDKLLAEEQKELLTPTEVCSILKISRSTYHRHVKSGRIEQLKQDGKAYVKRSSLEGWCV
ncbi:MAG: helix-turn-helix domain-containing protein [Prevotella sp.]|jgi:excisionase family DNA binding protein|nr:helix-turn-helix domain-containing protein [Prevotella sp.]